jgi:hypothetical protein
MVEAQDSCKLDGSWTSVGNISYQWIPFKGRPKAPIVLVILLPSHSEPQSHKLSESQSNTGKFGLVVNCGTHTHRSCKIATSCPLSLFRSLRMSRVNRKEVERGRPERTHGSVRRAIEYRLVRKGHSVVCARQMHGGLQRKPRNYQKISPRFVNLGDFPTSTPPNTTPRQGGRAL